MSEIIERDSAVVAAFFAECEAADEQFDGVSVLTLPAFERAVQKVRETAFAAGVERAGEAQANLVRMSEAAQARADRAVEAFNLVSPFIAKFAAAAKHYDGGRPRFKGSTLTHEADPSYTPALTGTATGIGGPGAPSSPTLGDLRMLAEAYAAALAISDLPGREGK